MECGPEAFTSAVAEAKELQAPRGMAVAAVSRWKLSIEMWWRRSFWATCGACILILPMSHPGAQMLSYQLVKKW